MITKFSTCLLFLALLLNSCQQRNQPTSPQYEAEYNRSTAVFFGVTVFGESLTLRLCCGIILIILAVTLIIAGSNVTSHLVRFRKLFPRLPLKKKNAKS